LKITKRLFHSMQHFVFKNIAIIMMKTQNLQECHWQLLRNICKI